MREGETNRGTGNDYFLGVEQTGKKPFTESQPIRKRQIHTIGKLGNGILRPKKSYIKFGKVFVPKKPVIRTSKSSLSDEQKTKDLAKQIADSIQARIDGVKAKEQQTEDTAKTESTGMSKALKGSLIAGGIILFIAGIVIVSRKKSQKLKTA